MARHVIGIMLVILCNSMRVMADPPENAGEGMSLGEPFWRSQAMDNEPVLFIQEEGKQLATNSTTTLFCKRACKFLEIAKNNDNQFVRDIFVPFGVPH